LSLSNVRVHVAFDDYPQPSLKDRERARQGTTAEDSRSYIITGPAQRRPNDISKVLTSRSFKRELPDFLAREWQDQANAHVLGTCDVFLDVPSGQCFHFHVSEGEVKRDTVDMLSNNHDEADTKICMHVKAADTSDGNVVLHASDTDIAVILLYHCEKSSSHIWMDVGTTFKHNRRFIDLTAISRSLGPQLCSSLPAFHAFTGSNYTAALGEKGQGWAL